MTSRSPRVQVMPFAVSLILITGMTGNSYGQSVEAPPCRTTIKTNQGQLDYCWPSGDGRMVVTKDAEGAAAAVWDVESGARRHLFEQEDAGKTVRVWDVVSPTERRLVFEEPIETVGSGPGIRRRHTRVEIEQPVRLRGNFLHIWPSLLPDNKRFVLSLLGGHQFYHGSKMDTSRDAIVVYDPELGRSQTIFSPDGGLPWSSRLVDYGCRPYRGSLIAYQALIHQDGDPLSTPRIVVYDLLEHRAMAQINPGGHDPMGYSISHEGELVCTTSLFPTSTRRRTAFAVRVHLWSARTGEAIAQVQTDGRSAREGIMSPKGRELALLCSEEYNRVFIVYVGRNKIERTLDDYARKTGLLRMRLGGINYTPDGSYLLGLGEDGTMMFWDTRDYREALWVRLYPSGYPRAYLSADGKKLMATGGGERDWGEVKVWDFDQFLALIPKDRRETRSVLGGSK